MFLVHFAASYSNFQLNYQYYLILYLDICIVTHLVIISSAWFYIKFMLHFIRLQVYTIMVLQLPNINFPNIETQRNNSQP